MVIAGLDVVASAELTDIGTDHFYAAMLEVDPVEGLRLSEMGAISCRRATSPSCGERLIGRKPRFSRQGPLRPR